MNSILKSIRIRLPGEWVDAWLYKETAVFWSPDGFLYYLPLREIRAAIERIAGRHVAVVADYLVFRNDWKQSKQFSDLLTFVPNLRDSLLSVFEGDSLTIEVEGVDQRLSRSAPHVGYILDTAVYGNRVYSAGESGLFETEFNPQFPESENPTIEVVDNEVLAVIANGGRAAFSCGEAGLRTRSIEFGFGKVWWDNLAKVGTVDDYSIDTSFSTLDLLNYTGDAAPHFLRARTRWEDPSGSAQYRQRIVVDYDQPLEMIGAIRKALNSNHRIAMSGEVVTDSLETGLKVIGNSNYHLLVSDNGRHSVINISALSDSKPARLYRNRGFREEKMGSGLVSNAISTQTVTSGFLLEGFDSTGLITERGTYVVIDEPRVRLRAFPRSRRHHDCFVAIGDNFVELVGYIEV